MDYQLLTWLTYYNNSISIQFILHIYIFNYLVSSIYKCIFLGKQYFVENSILLVNYLILSIPLANPKQIHHSVLLCFSITTSQNNTNRLVRRADFSSQDKQINYSNCWFIILWRAYTQPFLLHQCHIKSNHLQHFTKFSRRINWRWLATIPTFIFPPPPPTTSPLSNPKNCNIWPVSCLK